MTTTTPEPPFDFRVGDADAASSLGGYRLGDAPPPEAAPEYLTREAVASR